MKHYAIASVSYAKDLNTATEQLSKIVNEEMSQYESFSFIGGVSVDRTVITLSSGVIEQISVVQAFTVDLEEYNKFNKD